MDNLKKYYKYIGIAGCVIAIIGIFVPWIAALGATAALIDRYGIWPLLLLICSSALFFLESGLYALIVTGFALIWFIVDAITIFANGVLTITPSVGFYMMIVGMAISIVIAIMMMTKSKKEAQNGRI